MQELSIVQSGGPIENCQDCGQCCTHVGEPPGFAPFFSHAGRPVQREPGDAENHGIFERMPHDIKQGLYDYYLSVSQGQVRDRSTQDVACLWYDEQTKNCMNYEHRPTGCRAFEMGGEGCRLVRIHSGLDAG